MRVHGSLTSVRARLNPSLWLYADPWHLLSQVNIGCNEIGKVQGLNLVSIFKQKDQMKSVGLEGCNLGVDGAKAVADYVSISAVLTSINLSSNQLCGFNWNDEGIYTAEGITAIADALHVNSALTELNLSLNRIGAEGAKPLADALRVNGSLTSLNMDANELGDEGISAIATLLKDSTVTRLASLDLRANEIGPKGAESLAAWLAVSGALTMCHLSMNRMGNNGVAALREAVKGRAEFEHDLDDLHDDL